MNHAMVGMQGSMQMQKEDSLTDLMRGTSNAGFMSGNMNSFDEHEQQMDDNDDFNADALLMSPIFNDSAGRLNDTFIENDFGQFAAPAAAPPPPTHDNLLGQPRERGQMPPQAAMEYASPVTMQRANRPAIVRESRNVRMASMRNGMQGMGMMNQPVQSSFGGFDSRMPASSPSVDGNFHSMPPSQVGNDSNYLNHSQSDMPDYSMQSYTSQTRRMPESSFAMNNNSYGSESESPMVGRSNSSMYQTSQRSMMSPSRVLPPKAQSYAGHHHHLSSSQQQQPNDLVAMRQQLQEMREFEVQEAMQQSRDHSMNRSGRSMSQSMHAPVQRTASASTSMSQSIHFEPANNRFGGMPAGSPPFTGGNNVSIASDSQSFKSSLGGMEGSAAAGTSHVNEAMEKLCESMKRSAMSRSLVKQYSSGGRNGVSRHGSGPLYAMRQATGRNMNGMDDSSSGRGAPIRRHSNAKYQLQHPVRGVNRHASAGTNGGPSINFQIDGRQMGM